MLFHVFGGLVDQPDSQTKSLIVGMNYGPVKMKNRRFPLPRRNVIGKANESHLLHPIKQPKTMQFPARQIGVQIVILAKIFPRLGSNGSNVEVKFFSFFF